MRVRFRMASGDAYDELIETAPLQPFLGWQFHHLKETTYFYLVSAGNREGGILFPTIPLYQQMTGVRAVCETCERGLWEGLDPREADNAAGAHRKQGHATWLIPNEMGMTKMVHADLQVATARRWPMEG